MIRITEKHRCCGCSACQAACPKNCIALEADEEGFLYPSVNMDNCIKCRTCLHVCPMIHPAEEKPVPQHGWLVQNKDEAIRMDSSSGGAFSAIASSILEKGGVVFGAAYDDSFQIVHRYAETLEEIAGFRNSKYIQTNPGNCFREVKNFLDADRWVCFSGTPCQAEGLVRYLGHPYSKLLIVDVVCHGTASPLIWEKYLEYQGIQKQQIDNIRFRDKYYGYKYSTMSLLKKGKILYHAGAQKDPMLRAFFSDICDRPSCYQCPFKKRYRVSDLTLWDCFSVYDFDRDMDDDKGTTRVLCHTEKGALAVKEISHTAKCKPVVPDKLIKGSKEMFHSVKLNPKRKLFLQDAAVMSGKELFAKYYPVTFRIHLKTIVRHIFLMTNTYGTVKMLLNKVRGR